MGAPGIRVVGDGVVLSLYGSTGDDGISGSSIGEIIQSGIGDDTVFAGDGNDVVWADLGDDWLDGGAGVMDILNFGTINALQTNAALSTVGVKFDLEQDNTYDLGYYGTKTIYGFEGLIGSSVGDTLFGDSKNNNLNGFYGDDVLYGRGGRDLIEGNFGTDRIYGGSNGDTLCGDIHLETTDDGSRDIFIYSSLKDSGLGETTRDVIFGYFDGATGDKIDLSRLDANGSASGNGTFRFIGDDSFHTNSTGEVQVRATANANEYLVKIDTDTDSGSEMTLLVHSTSLLTASDFVL
jgi:serralysin